MPYEYTHTDVTGSEPRPFSCRLECRRCEAENNDGSTCKRRVCIWLPFCWQHNIKKLSLKVAQSKALPGSLGLFATEDFEKGDMVAPYGGEVIDAEETRKRYGMANEYGLGPYLLYSVDSACERYISSASNGGFGSIPKSARNVYFNNTSHRYGTVKRKGEKYNGKTLTKDNLGVKYWSFAKRRIAKGEELIADYGDEGYTEAFDRRMRKCNELGVECDITKLVR